MHMYMLSWHAVADLHRYALCSALLCAVVPFSSAKPTRSLVNQNFNLKFNVPGDLHYILATNSTRPPPYPDEPLERSPHRIRPWLICEGCIHNPRRFIATRGKEESNEQLANSRLWRMRDVTRTFVDIRAAPAWRPSAT
jgi:hypothetical protein